MYRNSNPSYFTDFTKTVLKWDFSTLSKPLAIATSGILPKTVDNISEYYHNFLPFILEETRAIIANGLERVHEHTHEGQAFNLRLKKQANLPRTEGNPMSLHFNGIIPIDIEHGNSMNVLLLKTTGVSPTKVLIALATEKPDTSELFAKIIMTSADYSEYQECFTAGSRWEAQYLGSIISEQRMYDACLEATDCACVQQIARARISTPCCTTRVLEKSCNMNDLNLSQEKAIYAFLNAKKGTTLLLQGPPGTGKTKTLITLLKQVAKPGTRTMVSAHSNKGVQVLASRAIEEMPNAPMILIGVASKLPEKLRPIFLQNWHDTILSAFSSHHHEIESLANTAVVHPSANILLSNIERDIRVAEQRLNNFALIHFRKLSNTQKQELYALSSDPLLTSDFIGFYDNIAQLKLQPHSQHLWNILLTRLNRFIGKWKNIKKEDLEEYLLNHASIIFSTLISAGRKNMLTMAPVDYLLVDEAAQSVEAATLIPMRFQPSKILLVGDTKQLPATVISAHLDDSDRRYSTHYKWSMMWRLIEENKQPSLMLDIQYRMHPHICQWPSEQYYENRLITAPTILPMSALNNTDITSRPYAIYQIPGQVTSHSGSHSVYNTQEVEYVLKIIKHIRLKNGTSSIGIITPYAEQKRLITEKISKRKHLQKFIDINTVDGFQGDERDIIIISFTRTHVSEFLKEFRRLNVAITRAKFCLIILAAPGLLSNDIGQLITDAKLRQVLYSEKELNRILQTGTIVSAEQEYKVNAELRTMAWQGKSDAQLQYARTLADKSQAILWYRRAAENNNAEAQYYIGQIYLSGNEIVKRDIQLGIAWLNNSARQNFPPTQYLLGKYCILGNVVVKNVALGIQYCECAVSSHLLDAIVFLAKLYDEGQEVPRQAKLAKKYYRLAAKQDHIESIEKLAGLLSVGTLENQDESLTWYQKIAVRKVTTAYYPLANLLHNVFGRQKEATHWYLKAAEQGNPKAQYELGLRFKNGTYGCATDIERSNYFFQQAAHAGHIESQFIYAGILKKQGKLEFTHFFKLAADQGHAESQYEFALLLSSQDKHMAYKYYFKAAQQNHLLAQQASVHYQIQFNCDLKACFDFCETLAMNDNAQAQFLLARILDTGLVGTANKSRAYHYYTLLAKNGHPLAQYHCAILLESGTDVDRDLVTARRYYQSCIEHCFGARLRLACLLLKEIDHDLPETQLICSGQNPNNVRDHEQDQKTTAEPYRKPIELLEYYFKHYPKDKSLVNTLEQHLENLVLNTRATYSVYNLGVVNTRSAHANYLLGRIFEEGTGVIVNVTRALQHYQLASTQYPDASYRAGYIYESGLGVTKNSAYAKTYYKNAANKGHELAAKRLTWSYWLSTKKDNVPNDETLKKAESHNCAMM